MLHKTTHEYNHVVYKEESVNQAAALHDIADDDFERPSCWVFDFEMYFLHFFLVNIILPCFSF